MVMVEVILLKNEFINKFNFILLKTFLNYSVS